MSWVEDNMETLILPCQWYPTQCDTPEKKLMIAVLEESIDDYQVKITHRTGSKAIRWHVEAKDWLFSDDEYPYSFVDVCRNLNLTPDYIRKGLKLNAGRLPRSIRGSVVHDIHMKASQPRPYRNGLKYKKKRENEDSLDSSKDVFEL